jgi:hypothetical protein
MLDAEVIQFQTLPGFTTPQIIITDRRDPDHRIIGYDDPWLAGEDETTRYIPQRLVAGVWLAYVIEDRGQLETVSERCLEWALADTRTLDQDPTVELHKHGHRA